MGIDVHVGKFLLHVTARQALGSVATIGRQCVHMDEASIKRMFGSKADVPYGSFCEPLLVSRLGASQVVSFDASDYEGASYIHDFNTPLLHDKTYDSVLDLGTSEHIYDVSRAFSNVSSLCAPGGQIIHVLPANNFCGHGFYQFSPEFFYTLYSSENGYQETEVYIAQLEDTENWYLARRPYEGSRVEFTSSSPAYNLVRTVRSATDGVPSVQQSDYRFPWAGETNLPSVSERANGTFASRVVERLVRALGRGKAPDVRELSRNPSFHRVAA